MTGGDLGSPRIFPHRSTEDHAVRNRLGRLLADTPIPPGELIDNLALPSVHNSPQAKEGDR